MKSITLSIALILASALPGAYLSWRLLHTAGLSGVWLALGSAMLAMVLATALYAGLTSLVRAAFSPAQKSETP
jgi:hypothetical protein